MSDDLVGASMQRAMLDVSSMQPVYLGRLERQLHLIEECLEQLQRAKQFIDDGSESQGYWAMSLRERASFCNEATKILRSLKIQLNEKIDRVEETVEMSTLMIKAMRFDARQAMEGIQ